MNIVPSREREREWYLPKGGLFVADVMSCARARSMRARSPRGPGCSATGAMTSTGGCAMTGTGPTRPHMDTGSWSGRTGIGDQQQEIINSSWNIFSLLLRTGMRETGWTGADRGRVCMSASSRAPNMRWGMLCYSSDIETFHGVIDITRASTTMTRRRVRASTAGAMEIGTRASGRRDSDMDMASMYGRIKMKSMTHDIRSLSGDNPSTLLRYLSFVDSIIHCIIALLSFNLKNSS